MIKILLDYNNFSNIYSMLIEKGFYWSCNASSCKGVLSIRDKGYFVNSRLSLRQILIICSYWFHKFKGVRS